MKSKKKQTKSRKIWIPILIILLLAVGGGVYYYLSQAGVVSVATATDVAPKTTTVRSGSITLSASGTGTLIASKETDLSFSTSAVVATVNVQVGDQVKMGTVLAELSDINDLKDSVNSAQQNLISAQQALDTLNQNAPANLANAQLAVINAQKAVTDAKSAVVQKGVPRCDQDTIDAYYSTWQTEKNYLDTLGSGAGNPDYYNAVIVPQKIVVAQAYATYVYCAGYTEYEIDSSHTNLDVANATLTQAQSTLADLQKNNGLDPTALASAENTVANAQVAVDQAQQTLTGATLVAPFDGTILTVAGQAGDTSVSPFITIADLTHPQIQFDVDETDMDKVALNEEAQVSFDAIAGRTFTGKVIQINPTLQTLNGYQVVQGLIQLDLSQETNPPTFQKGLAASVEVIKAKADNALLVPLQAVRDLGDGSYGVFVVGSDGQPTLKIVKVGLEDLINAEITQGLSAGQTVTTGISETK
jgi:multidrug efflux pump subunit AcrA (membrane-fusion protein)